ncbi:hypothetical protein J2W32_004438 [Variovorax boronicumulans]|uniref:DUF1488 domain-containing protein n=1 Tax=Variovorax boronicumulans TaxID=436515 RepID=A0AAW8D7S0_9BURK|nr:hypothetical protein [Variovorax boronicumulans]MDP9895340.1 hypothetical protein [Variovorax boronicumulans]MDQ0055380.1 hypothetical protein [Variovorax boronicumulans]
MPSSVSTATRPAPTVSARRAPLPITVDCLPEGARALVISIDDDTVQFVGRPLVMGESVLNIQRDLLRHLNEKPLSTEWLEQLRDYCDSRLAARAEARATGRIVTPNPRANWDMTSIAALRGE